MRDYWKEFREAGHTTRREQEIADDKEARNRTKKFSTPSGWSTMRGGRYSMTRPDGKKIDLYVDITGMWIIFIDNVRIDVQPTLGTAKKKALAWQPSI
jgi:hypothetical protein